MAASQNARSPAHRHRRSRGWGRRRPGCRRSPPHYQALPAQLRERLAQGSVEHGLGGEPGRGVGFAVAVVAAAPLQHLEEQAVDGAGEEVQEFAAAGAVVEDAFGAQALGRTRRPGRSGRRGPRSSCSGSAAAARSAPRRRRRRCRRQANAMCWAPAPAVRSMNRPAADGLRLRCIERQAQGTVVVGQGTADDQAARVVEIRARLGLQGRGWRGRTGSSSGTRSAGRPGRDGRCVSRPSSGPPARRVGQEVDLDEPPCSPSALSTK